MSMNKRRRDLCRHLHLDNPIGFADYGCLVKKSRLWKIRLQYTNVCQVEINQHRHRPPTLNILCPSFDPSLDERLHPSLQGSVVQILANDSIDASAIASVFRNHSNNGVDKTCFDFERLPTELHVKILSYLSCFQLINTALVCKQWNKISKCARDVKRCMRMEANEDTGVDDKIFNRWLGDNKILTCFKHNPYCYLRMSAIEILGSKCPHLEVLELDTLFLTDEGLRVIASGCSNLKRGRFEGHNISEVGIRWIFVLCKELEHLEIINNRRIKGLWFHERFPNFKTLVLSGCVRIRKFADTFQCFPNLVSLRLRYCFLFDDDLKNIIENCPKIEQLEIYSLHDISGLGLQSIAGLGNLKSLSIEDMPAFGIDDALNDISKNCRNLNDLNIARCENMTDFWARSLRMLPNLKTLYINHMDYITSKSLKAISSCKNLRSLSIEGCKNVDNNGPLAVVAKCLNLEVLRVSNIKRINTDFIVNCYKCVDMERHAKTLNIEVHGCSVFTADLMKQYPSIRADECHFFVKCREDGKCRDAAKWLWGFSEMTPNDGGIEECEYWCQQY